MRAALQFDLGHDRVHGDGGDDADESIAGAAAHTRRVGRGVRLVDREGGERGSVNREATGGVGSRGKATTVDPASHGVVADAEQLGGLTDPILRHKQQNSTASAGVIARLFRKPRRAGPETARGWPALRITPANCPFLLVRSAQLGA